MTFRSTDIQETDIYHRSDSVAFREVGNEVLLVPVRTDPKEASGVYTLNRTASFLWMQIDGKKDVAALVLTVVDQFEVPKVQAEKDTRVFLGDLLSFDAIVKGSIPAAVP